MMVPAADFEPTWVKTMANGQLGEARVRALLLERFHVMTRSVDMDGADFFVQLRSSGRFSDLLAPRIGVIQAKFAQNDKTSHLLPVSYSVDGEDSIKEFFVVISVGHEDGVRFFLLSAEDLKTLPTTAVEGVDHYRLTAKKRAPFLVKKVTAALDRIEASLAARTDEQNERFLRTVHIPDFQVQRKALDPVWFWLVPNEHGFIPDIVWKLRISLRAELYSLDDFVGGVATALKASDAKACLAATDGILDANNIDENDTASRLVLDLTSPGELRDALRKAIATHEGRIRKLKRHGHWRRFRELEARILQDHLPFHDRHAQPKLVRAGKNMRRLSDRHAQTIVRYDPTTFEIQSVVTQLVRNGTPNPSGAGMLSWSRMLWQGGFEEGAIAWRNLHRLRAEVMSEYYRLLVPNDVIGKLALPVGLSE